MSYADNPSIANDDELWRRIPPRWIIFDSNLNRWRPSSAAFEDDQDGRPMSVYIARLVKAANASETVVLAGHDGYGLAGFAAALARANKQIIALEETEIPGHAVVVGEKKKSVSRAFAKSSRWVFLPVRNELPGVQ